MLVIDASPIIAFYSEMKVPELLHKLVEFDNCLVIPIAVSNEIKKGRDKHNTFFILETAKKDGYIEIYENFSTDEILTFQHRYPNLNDGEIQVLILGNKFKNEGEEYCCVIDESPATKVAKKLSIFRKGTLGLLDILDEIGIINKVEKTKLLNRLEKSRFRI